MSTQTPTQTQKQSLQINLDYDACGEYGVNSASCRKVKENWRETLTRNPGLIRTIAEIYAEFHGGTDEEIREVLKAQVELLLAVWLQRSGSVRLGAELEEIVNNAYNVLRQRGILLDVPDDLEELERRIFIDWTSILHTLQYVYVRE